MRALKHPIRPEDFCGFPRTLSLTSGFSALAGLPPTMTCPTLWQRRRAGYGKVAAEQARAAARKGDRAAAAQIPSADTGQ